jgi:flavin reductase (DIM6/NTAB) family NADH-FMN oxidoreductase RutF
MSNKIQVKVNTTLYPVPVVLITCGTGGEFNVFSVNRISSCNAEPPMIAISVRPARASHDLIDRHRDFVVNIPWPEMEIVSDFVGATTIRETDKWAETGLTRSEAAGVRPPLLADCPVNIECRVIQKVSLPSHSLFIAEVVAMHADEAVLNEQGEVDFALARGGLPYRAGPVRERPVDNFRPDALRQGVHHWRDGRTTP